MLHLTKKPIATTMYRETKWQVRINVYIDVDEMGWKYSILREFQFLCRSLTICSQMRFLCRLEKGMSFVWEFLYWNIVKKIVENKTSY